MAILVDERTEVIVQGLGPEAARAVAVMRAGGTPVLAAVDPARADAVWQGLRVYATAPAAVEAEGGNATVVAVDAADVHAALLEALDANLALIVCATAGVPRERVAGIRDALYPAGSNPEEPGLPLLLGPGSAGVLSPGRGVVGGLPAGLARPGPVGLVGRLAPADHDVVRALGQGGLSTVVGLGLEPASGADFPEVARRFAADPATRLTVLVGTSTDPELARAARWLVEHDTRAAVWVTDGRPLDVPDLPVVFSADEAVTLVRRLNSTG